MYSITMYNNIYYYQCTRYIELILTQSALDKIRIHLISAKFKANIVGIQLISIKFDININFIHTNTWCKYKNKRIK